MTLQPVMSEIAKVATSPLFKTDLGHHSHAGATGGTCSKFHFKFSSTYGTHIKKVNVLRAYYTYGYGRTTLTATGVLRLRLRGYFAYSYGSTWSKATGVLRLQLRAYRGYNYGRATGVLCGRV